jgi:predicted small metal-binding protein
MVIVNNHANNLHNLQDFNDKIVDLVKKKICIF